MGFTIGSAARKGALVAFLGTMTLAPVTVAQDATPVPYTAPEDIADISGSLESDGSSTVGPVTEAVIEEFAAVAPGITVTNGISGTGGGFERFTIGEIPIANASRPIADDEVELAAQNGIEYYRFDVAYDGISVVVSAENEFLESLTVEQLAQLWSADGGVTNWSDLDPSFPDEPVELYGPGADSGTFDFFNEEVLGEDVGVRTDYNPSEDDNVLVEGVAGSPNALGYFGYAYYEANAESLRLVPIDNGDGPVEPSVETIGNGTYAPLSRPLFIYVNAETLQSDPALQEFLRFYLASSAELSADVGYVALPAELGVEQQTKLEGAISGEVAPDSLTMEATPAATPS